MPLAERAALAVLSAQPDANTRDSERRDGQRFRGRPVERLFATSHGQTMRDPLLNFSVRMKSGRQLRLRVEQPNERLAIHSGLDVHGIGLWPPGPAGPQVGWLRRLLLRPREPVLEPFA